MSEAGKDGAESKVRLSGLGMSASMDHGLHSLEEAASGSRGPAGSSRKLRVPRLMWCWATRAYQSEVGVSLDGAESGCKLYIFINYF